MFVLFCSHQIFILLFTFFIYVSYHLSRKPISVVKVCEVHCQFLQFLLTNCLQIGSWAYFHRALCCRKGEMTRRYMGSAICCFLHK